MLVLIDFWRFVLRFKHREVQSVQFDVSLLILIDSDLAVCRCLGEEKVEQYFSSTERQKRKRERERDRRRERRERDNDSDEKKVNEWIANENGERKRNRKKKAKSHFHS